jgi:hypothetical protein
VSNKSDQAERRAILKNDQPAATTFHQQAMIGLALEQGGRFAKDTIVTGAEPAVQYPRQPSGPWASDPVPAEEPLGFAIDAMEAVGTAAEIEASLGRSAAPVASPDGSTAQASSPHAPSCWLDSC